MSQLTPTMPAACQAAAQKAVAQHKATGNTSEYEDSNEPCQNQICKGSNRNAATSCVPGKARGQCQSASLWGKFSVSLTCCSMQ